MERTNSYKKTEVGVIPEDWEVRQVGDILKVKHGKSQHQVVDENGQYPILATGGEIGRANQYLFDKPSVLIGRKGTIDRPQYIETPFWSIDTLFYTEISRKAIAKYIYYLFDRIDWYSYNEASGVPSLNASTIEKINIPLPPLPEQKAIAKVLSDVDELITSIEELIDKKQKIKQGTMQLLLTGKKRLPGFTGEWEVKTLYEAVDCLDNLRVPLNETQRASMKGDYPYCGANGVLDYINQYIIDDDIILIAEDGGHFDEYMNKPIAYRISGKCWVNNHAHILKAKEHICQDFIFYSLVHKNILEYLSGGTRAKLNKSELFKIEIYIPNSLSEQKAIAQILSDMDLEIEALEKKLEKYKLIKDGMMEQLLTGKVRLI